MRRRLRYAALAGLLLLLANLAGADSINQIMGTASKDASNVWWHFPNLQRVLGFPRTAAGDTAFRNQTPAFVLVGPTIGVDEGLDSNSTAPTIVNDTGESPISNTGAADNSLLVTNISVMQPSDNVDAVNVVLHQVLSPRSDALASFNVWPSGNVIFDGTNWTRWRQAITTGAIITTGIPATGLFAMDTANAGWRNIVTANNLTGDALSGGSTLPVVPTTFNGTTWDRVRSVDATTLSDTISVGTALTAPLSTWSVTNTPATATQATASRAAGAAGVRHVATTVTVCLAAGATAQTPVVVNLRDGATGAGTVLRSWAISAPVNDSKCSDISGLAMIGTAATAMTIEFAAAGVAASQQTVTLTGFSVN